MTHDGVDMMACCKAGGRRIEELLEKKNSYRFMIVLSIALAISSALFAVLHRQSTAIALAVLMGVFLIFSSWAYIFHIKRKQIDYVQGINRTGTL